MAHSSQRIISRRMIISVGAMPRWLSRLHHVHRRRMIISTLAQCPHASLTERPAHPIDARTLPAKPFLLTPARGGFSASTRRTVHIIKLWTGGDSDDHNVSSQSWSASWPIFSVMCLARHLDLSYPKYVSFVRGVVYIFWLLNTREEMTIWVTPIVLSEEARY